MIAVKDVSNMHEGDELTLKRVSAVIDKWLQSSPDAIVSVQLNTPLHALENSAHVPNTPQVVPWRVWNQIAREYREAGWEVSMVNEGDRNATNYVLRIVLPPGERAFK